MKPTALLIPDCPYRPRRSTLGVALSLLSAGALAASPLQVPDARRVAQAIANAHESAGTDLVARTSLVNTRKTTIVHATQTWHGHRVWGAEAVVHAEATGRTRIAASSIGQTPQPAGAATLTQD